MHIKLTIGFPLTLLALSACSRTDHIGKEPPFSDASGGVEHVAMLSPSLPVSTEQQLPQQQASLWSKNRYSLLGDRRADKKGDILTVVIEIDEKAEISNKTTQSRTGSESLSVPGLFGIPQRINGKLPEGASMDEAVSIDSSSSASGNGAVRRNEKLTLRIAATVVDVLPNGVLFLTGTQEVRVNFEMRELSITGFVRPADISRQNEITYDKIASARVSYGGRGHISDQQQPRYGQQILQRVLPF